MKLGAALATVLLVATAACHSSGDSVTSPPPSRFLFAMRSVTGSAGQFVAETSDPALRATLRAQLALPVDQRNLHISGAIARGNGGDNLSWSWHFVPGEWDMVELSAETCDGTPQMVEDDLATWVDKIGTFCPWTSYVQSAL